MTLRGFCLTFLVGGGILLGESLFSREASAQSGVCEGSARQVELACQSWTEIDEALSRGARTVIIPVGGTEQSGPYMAVGKHNVRAQLLSDEVARRLGNTYVAPVIAYVPEGSTSPRRSHMRFPGTLSVSPAVFGGLIEGAAESLRVQGFHTIVLLGDHGGYQGQLGQIADHLNHRWTVAGIKTVHILFVHDYYNVVPTKYADALRERGYGKAVGLHAELSDTSLMLAVDPSLVRQDALRHALKPNSADGVYGGDPRQATAELGQVGTAMQIRAAVDAISSFNRSHL
ncbi:creatininase family protein [Saccharibacter sp. 17.LH.SD]|uniref:creatininase family protein n=1 Tax=Saccharibacter sp. 17.LH.SD TaxID=2689393 RepID=UPI00136DCFC6|nr:creatininase family protein [Saccharibacter sp. 17.LH.SD]MXV45244.1 creatininase family protein [Saccharibacter sp. 17.LH.SD]